MNGRTLFLGLACVLLLSVGANSAEEDQSPAKAIIETASPDTAAMRFFERMDTNKDGLVAAEEFRGGDQAFSRWDLDESGDISAEEYQQAWQDRRRQWSHARTGEATGEVSWFQRLDKDENGSISREEFKGSDRQFSHLDADEDGTISEDEWRSVLEHATNRARGVQSQGNPPGSAKRDEDANGLISREEFPGSDEAFSNLDQDGDGYISHEERRQSRHQNRHGQERDSDEGPGNGRRNRR